ncbi:hypothetical protein KUCAC02_032857 [Chaenocephalus aceratus]|nr:hypothetical protein KUCAC02_032857 [Chaenocephalus aceratus]
MLFSPSGFTECLGEWDDLEKNYQQIQDTHRLYKQKLEEVTRLQGSCSGAISRQRKKLRELRVSLQECKDNHPTPKLNPEDVDSIAEVQSLIRERGEAFSEMEAFLPQKNGLYLNLVLGNVNVTLLNKQSKFAYKDEYEKFKLVLTVILFVFSFTCRFLFSYRVLDALFNFLLVWYYCTLTIRESVLINNGSRIKGWWVFHHYVSTFLSGVMLTWPEGALYQMFRNQFLTYCLYQSFVQFLQYYYQSGCLYRLRALGEKHNMDVTVEGFQFLDVERSDLPASFPVLRSLLAALQQHHSVHDVPAPRVQRVAGGDVRLLLPGALHGELPHHAGSRLPEIQEQPGQETQEPLDTEAPTCSKKPALKFSLERLPLID